MLQQEAMNEMCSCSSYRVYYAIYGELHLKKGENFLFNNILNNILNQKYSNSLEASRSFSSHQLS